MTSQAFSAHSIWLHSNFSPSSKITMIVLACYLIVQELKRKSNSCAWACICVDRKLPLCLHRWRAFSKCFVLFRAAFTNHDWTIEKHFLTNFSQYNTNKVYVTEWMAQICPISLTKSFSLVLRTLPPMVSYLQAMSLGQSVVAMSPSVVTALAMEMELSIRITNVRCIDAAVAIFPAVYSQKVAWKI